MSLYFAALDASTFCGDDGVQSILGLVGLAITILKWAVPILLIIIALFDLGKAVVGQDPEKIKNTYSGLIKRAIAALIIFFIPAIVGLLLDAVDGREYSLSACTTALDLGL